jgi:hypothetical protein
MRCQSSLTKLFYFLCLLADSVGYHQEKEIKASQPADYTDKHYTQLYVCVYVVKLLSYAKAHL